MQAQNVDEQAEPDPALWGQADHQEELEQHAVKYPVLGQRAEHGQERDHHALKRPAWWRQPHNREEPERHRFKPASDAQLGQALVLLCRAEASQEGHAMLDQTARSCTTGCFDLEGPYPRWASLRRCGRCEAINLLLQAPIEGSTIHNSLISQSLMSTRCESEGQRTGVIPNLSEKIIDRIIATFLSSLQPRLSASGHFSVEFLCQVLSEPETNAAIRALLHTSRQLREVITQLLPLRLHGCCHHPEAPDLVLAQHHESISPKLDAFVRTAVRWVLLPASTKLRQPLSGLVPDCRESIVSVGLQVSLVHVIRFTVYMPDNKQSVEPIDVRRGCSGESCTQVDISRASLTVRDACQELVNALNKTSMDSRSANPYFRALSWLRNQSDPRPNVAVAMELGQFSVSGQDPSHYEAWIFDHHSTAVPCPFPCYWC